MNGDGFFHAQRLRSSREARMNSVLTNNSFWFPMNRESMRVANEGMSMRKLVLHRDGFTIGTVGVNSQSSNIETK